MGTDSKKSNLEIGIQYDQVTFWLNVGPDCSVKFIGYLSNTFLQEEYKGRY